MGVDPLADSYPTPDALRQFYGATEQELAAIPGVTSAAWTSTLPLGGSMAGRVFYDVAGEEPFAPAERPTADLHVVSDAYFRTLDELETPTQLYWSFARLPDDDVFLVVRPTSGNAAALAPRFVRRSRASTAF